jgi:hypothetical protein
MGPPQARSGYLILVALPVASKAAVKLIGPRLMRWSIQMEGFGGAAQPAPAIGLPEWWLAAADPRPPSSGPRPFLCPQPALPMNAGLKTCKAEREEIAPASHHKPRLTIP